MNYSLIICPDAAGQNIKHFLKIPFTEVEQRSIFCEHLDEKIEGDILIFATTHRSVQGVQSLAVHFPGNFGKADLGGKERKLCIAPASLLKELYLGLKKRYSGEVTIEATHHGPFLKKPTVFIEIGSNEENWKDPVLGKIVADTLHEVLGREQKYRTVVVLGGGHYSLEVNKILTDTEYAVGHFCPKHNLVYLDEEMLLQMYEKNVEKVECFALDWKGMGGEKERIISLLEKLKLPYKKIKDIRGHTKE